MSDAEKAAEAWIDSEYDAMPGGLTHKLSKKAFLAGYAAAQQWRPIESAPKDGTVVLLLGSSERHADGFWEPKAYNNNGAWIWPFIRAEPTHWMPLPLPPSE